MKENNSAERNAVVYLQLPMTPIEYARQRLWDYKMRAERLHNVGLHQAAEAAQAMSLRWQHRIMELVRERRRRWPSRRKAAGPSQAGSHTGRNEREIAPVSVRRNSCQVG